jgi:hypothetical protein
MPKTGSNTRYPLFKILDFPLILAAAGFCVFLFFLAAGQSSGKLLVEIKTEKQTYLFPLDENRTFVAEGPLGGTLVAISDGEAHVVDSPCKEKICIQAGQIKKAGEWIACLPNKVLVAIKGKPDEKIDVVSY